MSQSTTKWIASNAVTNAKLAQMPANTVKANTTGSTANASDVALGTLTEATSSVLTLTGWTDATIGSPTIEVKQSSGSQSGYLSSTDWNTFNNKGSGSVTSVSVVTANGVSGSVATPTTTPAITLTLGAITPSSVAATGTVTGSNLSGTNTGDVTLSAFGSSPNANGASLSGQALTLQPADATHPGGVSTASQTFGGSKVFATAPAITDTSAAHNVILQATSSTALTADRTLTIDTNNVSSTLKMGANLTVSATATVSGTNSGDVTLAAVGASPNANAATLSGQVLNLEKFSSTQPGVVPASGGGTTNFLRADGTWAAASGGSSTAPTIQKFTSGSGTYTTPTSPAPLYIRVVAVGGGGGGGSDGGSTTTGTAGGNTTFGTSLIAANGGNGGTSGGTGSGGGTGGTASLGTAVGIAVTGGAGGSRPLSVQPVSGSVTGGQGASSFFGGAGRASSGSGGAGQANTGAGGAGGAGTTTNTAGNGGGAGGYVDGIITSPSATYSYAVGAGGAGDNNGNATAGGAGGSGVIVVYEFYQ